MNRIINININGIVFHVDESAYERLKNYLDALKNYFQNTEGKDEILSDIESRIGEMLQQDLKGSKEVILMADVERVIAAMGMPEDLGFTNEKENTAGSNTYTQYEPQGDRVKRLYRNIDQKVLGGVCSGIAAYFNIDSLWIRILFLIAFFGFGTGLLLYLILWIVMPAARTAAEKLEMKGYDVNIANLTKSFQGEIKDFTQKKKETLRAEFQDYKSHEHFKSNIHTFFEIVGKVVGVVLVVVGSLVLISLIAGLLGFQGIMSNNMEAQLKTFTNTIPYNWLTLLGLALLIGTPFVFVIWTGIRLMAKIRLGNFALISGLLFMVWLAGVGITAYEFTKVAQGFKYNDVVTQDEIIPFDQDTLFLEANNAASGILFKRHRHHYSREFFKIKIDSIEFFKVHFDIQKSKDSNLHLIMDKTSRGSSPVEAHSMANSLSYQYKLNQSTLYLDQIFHLNSNTWRKQQLDITLLVPEGKTVFIKDNMENIIYDLDNVQNVLDHNMLNRYWKMTPQGLNCLNCPDNIIRNDGRNQDDEEEDDEILNWETKVQTKKPSILVI